MAARYAGHTPTSTNGPTRQRPCIVGATQPSNLMTFPVATSGDELLELDVLAHEAGRHRGDAVELVVVVEDLPAPGGDLGVDAVNAPGDKPVLLRRPIVRADVLGGLAERGFQHGLQNRSRLQVAGVLEQAFEVEHELRPPALHGRDRVDVAFVLKFDAVALRGQAPDGADPRAPSPGRAARTARASRCRGRRGRSAAGRPDRPGSATTSGGR